MDDKRSGSVTNGDMYLRSNTSGREEEFVGWVCGMVSSSFYMLPVGGEMSSVLVDGHWHEAVWLCVSLQGLYVSPQSWLHCVFAWFRRMLSICGLGLGICTLLVCLCTCVGLQIGDRVMYGCMWLCVRDLCVFGMFTLMGVWITSLVLITQFEA